jgi:hypothetical protein
VVTGTVLALWGRRKTLDYINVDVASDEYTEAERSYSSSAGSSLQFPVSSAARWLDPWQVNPDALKAGLS